MLLFMDHLFVTLFEHHAGAALFADPIALIVGFVTWLPLPLSKGFLKKDRGLFHR